jgi:hypothetical protein
LCVEVVVMFSVCMLVAVMLVFVAEVALIARR